MIFDKFLGLFSNDLAVDLGTSNCRVFVSGQGVVLSEPSLVAIEKDARGVPNVLEIGTRAKEMLGRTPPGVDVVAPLKDGAIDNFDVTSAMLRYFFTKAHSRRMLVSPRAVISVPYGLSQVARRVVKDAAESAGARDVQLVEKPMASAIGTGLPIGEPAGNMIVDIGGGTTEVAIISLFGIAKCTAVRTGGDKMDEAIIEHVKRTHNLNIGKPTAESVKCTIGNAMDMGEDYVMEIRGSDVVSERPRIVEVTAEEIREALSGPVNDILAAINGAFINTQPELRGDILNNGIMLVGGGSNLRHLPELIRRELKLSPILFDRPFDAAVLGAGQVLDDPRLMARVAVSA